MFFFVEMDIVLSFYGQKKMVKKTWKVEDDDTSNFATTTYLDNITFKKSAYIHIMSTKTSLLPEKIT